MSSLLPFYQLAQLCVEKGIEDVIICPGSRNAPLTIAFTANKSLKCKSISDERSAAFIALGMSVQSKKTSVLICTSGSAALNFAPAIAEAFFQEIPLLVITADRPPEWINQYDGQTIFQENIYGKHIKKSYNWLADQTDDALILVERVSNEAINISKMAPMGPVHINIPIREPFYGGELISSINTWRNIISFQKHEILSEDLISKFEYCISASENKVLIVGQQNEIGQELLEKFANKFGFSILADVLGNIDSDIKNTDLIFRNPDENISKALKADFIISFGKSLISKPMKLFYRKFKAKKHWHVAENPAIIDPFQSITAKICMNASVFFEELLKVNFEQENKGLKTNLEHKNTANYMLESIARAPYGELKVLAQLLPIIPENSIIHVGNSMSVRYLNLLNEFLPQNSSVYANRGTSGIDGILSTAVGQALCTSKMVYCIIGDVSFQYDKNALWNNYLPNNLKIILLNNQGGVIFGMINGPKEQVSFEEFFRTHQRHHAQSIAEDNDYQYFKIKDDQDLDKLAEFIQSTEKAILEVFSDPNINEITYKSILTSF